MIKLLIFQLFMLSVLNGFTQVRLPQIIKDSMILQRDEKINVWGWAAADEKIKIIFKGKHYKIKADALGNWMIQLPPTKAGGPYTMDIIASNKIFLKEILFGDVWFCSGQSNMVHQINIHDITYAQEIEQANYPQIRQFLIPSLINLQGPQKDISTSYWNPAVGEKLRPFSAVAYFFAKQIYNKYKVPVGIINASVGGTPIEAWISEQGFKDFSSVTNSIEKNKNADYIDSFNKAQITTTKQALSIDAGLTGATKWYEEAYVPKGWRNINIPGYWEDQGIKNLHGVVWYRREINIPVEMAGKAAKVFLGRIVDADELYINGVQVGKTTYQYPQRRYQLSAGILKTGKNIFVIRVTNTNGKGGFVPDKPYCIFAGKDNVDLKGDWQYKVGSVFQPFAGAVVKQIINAQNQPTALYNAMVAPEINYNIKGICWYQGESNGEQPALYAKLLPALIKDWRNKWKKDSLPFLYVQLPGYMDYNYLPAQSNWALFREAQLKTLAVTNTAMAVAVDLGEWNDIHPDNKKDVGERLALAAEKVAYHENIVYSGPLFQSAFIDGGKISISFKNIGSGLITNDGEAPAEFAIAGADKNFVWATAKVVGTKIIVWSSEVTEPKYVRYAWSDNPVNPNLFNKEGLPASPFRSDE